MIIFFLLLVFYMVQAIYWQWKEDYKEAILNAIWANFYLSVLIYSKLGVG